MTCEQSIERLPWLLNGTLEEDEKQAVRSHLETCAACREAAAQTRDAGRIFAAHPPAAAWVAWVFGGEAEGFDRDLLARHLESCPSCAVEVELARTSRHLEEDERVVPFRAPVTAARPAPRRERYYLGSALAAGLVGLIAIGGWVHSVQSVPGPLSNARLVVAADSSPEATERGGAGLTLRGGEPQILAIPYGGDAGAYSSFEVEVVDRASGRRVTGTPVELDRAGRFVLSYRPDSLAPGRYTLRLKGRDGARSVDLATYELRIEP